MAIKVELPNGAGYYLPDTTPESSFIDTYEQFNSAMSVYKDFIDNLPTLDYSRVDELIDQIANSYSTLQEPSKVSQTPSTSSMESGFSLGASGYDQSGSTSASSGIRGSAGLGAFGKAATAVGMAAMGPVGLAIGSILGVNAYNSYNSQTAVADLVDATQAATNTDVASASKAYADLKDATVGSTMGKLNASPMGLAQTFADYLAANELTSATDKARADLLGATAKVGVGSLEQSELETAQQATMDRAETEYAPQGVFSSMADLFGFSSQAAPVGMSPTGVQAAQDDGRTGDQETDHGFESQTGGYGEVGAGGGIGL